MYRKRPPFALALRSVVLIVLFTIGALYFNRRGFYPPHGQPLVYALTISWLVAITTAMLISGKFKASPRLFTLARWENEGQVYDRTDIDIFRSVLLHSPLGWINASLHLDAGRSDSARLLKELNASEGVHWLTLILCSIVGISCLVGSYTVHGYVMLLIRVPFDLYPIMLQRRTRGRLCRVLRRQQCLAGGQVAGT
jgi:hypothetical protein